jgi:hypothetical protein
MGLCLIKLSIGTTLLLPLLSVEQALKVIRNKLRNDDTLAGQRHHGSTESYFENHILGLSGGRKVLLTER